MLAIVLMFAIIFGLTFLHVFGILGILMIDAMLAWFAVGNMHIAELVAFAFVVGLLIGYIFRCAIASEISKLALSKIIASLENAAKEDSDRIREEVSSVAAYLRKHL